MNYKLFKIKSILFCAFMLLTSFSCFAQYTGGRGDGFAMAEIGPSALGIKQAVNTNGVFLSPNPVTAGQNVNLRFEKPLPLNTELIITDLSGRTVRKETMMAGANQYIINTNGMLQGVYIIKINSLTYQTEKKLAVL